MSEIRLSMASRVGMATECLFILIMRPMLKARGIVGAWTAEHIKRDIEKVRK